MTFYSPKDCFSKFILSKYSNLVLLLLLGLSSATITTPFKDCAGYTNEHLSLSSVTFDHDPTEGEDLKINFVGTTKTDTAITQLELQMFQGDIQIQDDKQPQTLNYSTGDPVNIDYVYSVPGVVPSGQYTGKILMTNVTGAQLACYTFDMVFQDPSSAIIKQKSQSTSSQPKEELVLY